MEPSTRRSNIFFVSYIWVHFSEALGGHIYQSLTNVMGTYPVPARTARVYQDDPFLFSFLHVFPLSQVSWLNMLALISQLWKIPILTNYVEVVLPKRKYHPPIWHASSMRICPLPFPSNQSIVPAHHSSLPLMPCAVVATPISRTTSG